MMRIRRSLKRQVLSQIEWKISHCLLTRIEEYIIMYSININ